MALQCRHSYEPLALERQANGFMVGGAIADARGGVSSKLSVGPTADPLNRHTNIILEVKS